MTPNTKLWLALWSVVAGFLVFVLLCFFAVRGQKERVESIHRNFDGYVEKFAEADPLDCFVVIDGVTGVVELDNCGLFNKGDEK